MRKASSCFLIVLIISLRDIIKKIIGETQGKKNFMFSSVFFLLQLISAFSSAMCHVQCAMNWPI